MSHLNGILDKQREVVSAIIDAYGDTRVVGEAVESWTESHPNYAALMAQQDAAIDFLQDFKVDFLGKVADIQNLT